MLEILIVDDDATARTSLGYALIDAGHRVTEAVDGTAAAALVESRVFDVAICDIRLPGMDGITLFRRIRQRAPQTAVILMTAYAAIPDAVAALREGAYDYVTKPFDPEEFTLRIIGRIAERRALRQELEQARAQLSGRDVGASIIGHTPAIARLMERIDTLAQSDAPVLVRGESGTGKELVARTIHARGPRRAKPFVVVRCAAVTPDDVDATLRGAELRGPISTRRTDPPVVGDGWGGTVFLDEVSALSTHAQARLIELLRPDTAGIGVTGPLDARILSATSCDLRARVAAGTFREDLFFRLCVLDVDIPPLRDRKGDLPLLLQYFLSRLTPAGKVPPGISPRAWAAMTEYDYPGNVREFAHAVERALVLSRGSEIDLEHLPPELMHAPPKPRDGASAPCPPVAPLAVAMKDFERQHLLRALAAASGRKSAAAELLGISRKSLWEKLRQHDISGVELTDLPG
jgi:DNA-binding NtrC family response regulator